MLKFLIKSLKNKGYKIIELSYGCNIRNDIYATSYFIFAKKNDNYYMLTITIVGSKLEEVLKIEGDTEIVKDLFGKIEGCNGLFCKYEVRVDRGYAYTEES